ncbi:MAG: thioredoxin domain-containing protein [Bdellovibrionota bacterium]
MKIKLRAALASLTLIAFMGCKSTSSNKDGETFGTINNVSVKNADLTLQEKASLIRAEKQVYETAQRILENHYLLDWFTKYQASNKLASLNDARKDYFDKNTRVTNAEVNQFIKENATNKELLQIPESQRAPTVKQYLSKVAQSRAEQDLLTEAYKQDKIKLIAHAKPQEQVVQFENVGHAFAPNIKNPKVTIVEFADYQCPFCVKANSEIMKVVSLHKDKIQYIFVDFPLLDKHPQALPAALAAKCAANQGKYWEMHELIFDRKPMDELSSNKYMTYAQKLNLSMGQFNECLKDPVQKESIEADLNEGFRVGVNETPTIYLNGQKFDDYIAFDNLNAAVEKLMAHE